MAQSMFWGPLRSTLDDRNSRLSQKILQTTERQTFEGLTTQAAVQL